MLKKPKSFVLDPVNLGGWACRTQEVALCHGGIVEQRCGSRIQQDPHHKCQLDATVLVVLRIRTAAQPCEDSSWYSKLSQHCNECANVIRQCSTTLFAAPIDG